MSSIANLVRRVRKCVFEVERQNHFNHFRILFDRRVSKSSRSFANHVSFESNRVRRMSFVAETRIEISKNFSQDLSILFAYDAVVVFHRHVVFEIREELLKRVATQLFDHVENHLAYENHSIQFSLRNRLVDVRRNSLNAIATIDDIHVTRSKIDFLRHDSSNAYDRRAIAM